MMKRLFAALTALTVLLLPMAASANGKHGGFTKHKSESFFMVTAGKNFSIEMELEGNKLAVGTNRGTIVIHDREDRDVQHATVTATARMGGTGSLSLQEAVVTEEVKMFGSIFRLENLVIDTAGHWEILVEIEKEGVKDRAVFDFPDVGGQ